MSLLGVGTLFPETSPSPSPVLGTLPTSHPSQAPAVQLSGLDPVGVRQSGLSLVLSPSLSPDLLQLLGTQPARRMKEEC